MAAKGGKFTSGGAPNSPKTITSKPTSKGYVVRNPAKGTTRTVTPSTPTTIVTSDNGVVTETQGLTRRQARQAQEQISRRRERRYLTSIQRKSKRRLKQAERKGEKRVKRVEASLKKSAEQFERQKPKTFRGKPTVGTPTRKALVKAESKGTLQTNKRGYLTTPPVRKVSKELKQVQKVKTKSTAPLPGLDKTQARVARTVLREGDKVGATKKEKLAAVETGLVESGFTNYTNQELTDADSLGWRQERTSIYGQDATKPKQGARNFFSETKAQGGATAGELAANVQRPATQYRGRYDERKPEAAAILSAYERGKTPSRLRRREKALEGKAAKLGLRPKAPKKKAPRTPTIVKLGKVAQKKFGLTVGENPAFGGVDPVHTGGSFHYSGQAIDVTGDSAQLTAFNKFVATRFGDQLAEMFYDPGINIDNGVPTGPIGGHGTHVHVAIDEPGSAAYGLVAQARGLPTSGAPIGYYGSGPTPKAAQASAKRAKKAALTPTQKARRTMRKLKGLGIGTDTSESKASPTLSDLAAKYGVAV